LSSASQNCLPDDRFQPIAKYELLFRPEKPNTPIGWSKAFAIAGGGPIKINAIWSIAMHNPVPSFTHALRSLSAILTKAEAHCEDSNIDPNALLTARLFPDMMNFTSNILVACDTAKGLAARLSQTDNPSYEDNEASFTELQVRITKTIEFMETVPDAAFDGAGDREIVMKFGPEERTFIGSAYFNGFAIPNFYFHMTTAYNILRHNGVTLGKRDFLGAN
jgi:hypothetical protein